MLKRLTQQEQIDELTTLVYLLLHMLQDTGRLTSVETESILAGARMMSPLDTAPPDWSPTRAIWDKIRKA